MPTDLAVTSSRTPAGRNGSTRRHGPKESHETFPEQKDIVENHSKSKTNPLKPHTRFFTTGTLIVFFDLPLRNVFSNACTEHSTDNSFATVLHNRRYEFVEMTCWVPKHRSPHVHDQPKGTAHSLSCFGQDLLVPPSTSSESSRVEFHLLRFPVPKKALT